MLGNSPGIFRKHNAIFNYFVDLSVCDIELNDVEKGFEERWMISVILCPFTETPRTCFQFLVHFGGSTSFSCAAPSRRPHTNQLEVLLLKMSPHITFIVAEYSIRVKVLIRWETHSPLSITDFDMRSVPFFIVS